MKAGFRVLRQVDEQSRFLFQRDEEVVYDPAAVEKVLRKNNGEGLAALRDLRPLDRGIVGVIRAPSAVSSSCIPGPRLTYRTSPGAWPTLGSNARGRLETWARSRASAAAAAGVTSVQSAMTMKKTAA